MLSKGLIKLINSLEHKKYREKHKLFIAEGEKLVKDLIKMGAPVKVLISSKPFENVSKGTECILCNQSEIDKLSFLKNNQGIIALLEIKEKQPDFSSVNEKLSLGLDGIQDPGNMGTIIRLSNWFGIGTVFCSENCVDIYNPKVVQASMGAILGVDIFYLDLEQCIKKLQKVADYEVYGSFMNGKSIYSSRLKKNGILIMGNEGNGISPKVENLLTQKISIPAFNNEKRAAESLNVSVATGILLSEFARQRF